MKNRNGSNLFAFPLALVLLLAAGGVAAGCCSDVTTSTCFDWARSTTCPALDVAAGKLDVPEDEVTSDGTFWPAHDYFVDGRRIHEPASCCYDVVRTVCTKELH